MSLGMTGSLRSIHTACVFFRALCWEAGPGSSRRELTFPIPHDIRRALQTFVLSQHADTPRSGVQWPAPRFSGSKLKLPHTHLTTETTIPPQPGQFHLIQADPTSTRQKLPHLSQTATEHSSQMSPVHRELRKTTDLYTFPPWA